MNRRGQIFLLLTILSITFITAISSILLDIQRSQYLEPSADADKIYDVWGNTLYSIEQTIGIQIALNSQIPTGNGSFASEIQTHMDLLETYLNSRGFIASVNVISAIYNASSINGLYAEANMTTLISLQITSSSGASINQILTLDISYHAVAVEVVAGTQWLMTLAKTVNNQTTYLTDISYSVLGGGDLDDNYNGSYYLNGSDEYSITTSENVLLIIQT